MTKYNDDELAKWSGENNVKKAPQYRVPIVKLDGEDGKFYQLGDKGEKILMGNALKGVILRVRRVIRGYTDNESYYSREHDGWTQKVELIESKQTEKGFTRKMVDCGTYQELKNNPTWTKIISLNFHLYFWFGKKDDDVVKLVVRGKGCVSLLDYFKTFGKDEHLHNFLTVLSVKDFEHPKLKKKYYAIEFTRGKSFEEEEKEVIGDMMKEIHDKIEAVENYYDSRKSDIGNGFDERVFKPIKDEDIPVVDGDDFKNPDNVSEDEINAKFDIVKGIDDGELDVKKIPF